MLLFEDDNLYLRFATGVATLNSFVIPEELPLQLVGRNPGEIAASGSGRKTIWWSLFSAGRNSVILRMGLPLPPAVSN